MLFYAVVPLIYFGVMGQVTASKSHTFLIANRYK